MKKLALAVASVSLVLGAPAAAVAQAPSCGYDHVCEEKDHGRKNHHGGHHHHGGGGAHATGAAVGSPGILSGNVVQIPIHIPINVCGNTVNVIGALNPAFGNTCINA
jgi:hypothetical protein